MDETLTAVFDGQVLRRDTPPNLEPNTRYLVTVRKVGAQFKEGDAWEVLDEHAGSVDAPLIGLPSTTIIFTAPPSGGIKPSHER